MIRRALMVLGLGVALTGGAATAVHAQTADPDATAPCVAATATTPETGNCDNSQNTLGPEDTASAEGRTAGPDTNNVQSGP
jgi:hypothetical protein